MMGRHQKTSKPLNEAFLLREENADSRQMKPSALSFFLSFWN